MELAKRILTYRVQNDIKQKEMAIILGISNRTLCDIEIGKKVSLKTIVKVETKLDELERRD